MKRLIISLFIIAITVSLINNVQAVTQNTNEKGKITASASAQKNIAPDTATVTFSIRTTDKNSQKAVELNNNKVKVMTAAIKNNLSDKDLIKTSNYVLRPNYEYSNFLKKNVINGYTVENSVTVTLKDTQKTGKIIDTATKNGADEVKNLSFTLQNTNSACQELTRKAVEKAKADAINVLSPLGKTIDAIYSINYSCSSQTNFPQYRNTLKTMAGADSVEESVNIEQGETKVEASVTIVFTIK